MSNESESPTDDVVLWRKRIPLKAATLRMLEQEARTTVRSPEGMAAFIIEDYFKRNGKATSNG